MNIQKITSIFGDTITQRGLDYFKQNKVSELEKVRSTWFAKVEGTFPYYVTLSLNKQGGLSKAECTCPYEYRCKHIVAVWFEVLAKMGNIHNLSQTQIVPPTEDELYIRDLRNVCNQYSGGCDYWEAQRFADELSIFIDNLEDLSEDYRFKLLKALYGRLSKIIQHSDDSDGLLGEIMGQTAFHLNQLYQTTQNRKLRTNIEHFWKRWIDNKEFFWLAETFGILEHWQTALNKSNRSQQVLDWITEYEKNAEWYQQNAIMVWRYQALRYQDPSLAEKFLADNLSFAEIRNLAIELALEQENYSLLEKLISEGLATNQARIYQQGWQEILLNVAKKTNQRDKVIDCAEKLLIDTNNSIHLSAYQSLKATCSDLEWQEKASKIEHHIAQSGLNSKLADFFILEKAFDKLQNLLISHSNLSFVASYAEKIPKAQREKVIFHWLYLLEKEIETMNTGSKYVGWVRTINRLLKKYPYIYNELSEVVARIKANYSRRPALIRELEAIKL